MQKKKSVSLVHEDVIDIHQMGLIKPPEFYPMTHEDFSNWKPSLSYPEQADPKMISKYPKALVYAEADTEYSLEEIKARQYLTARPNNSLNVPYCETEQAIQSILEEPPISAGAIHKSTYTLPLQVHEISHHSPQRSPHYNEPANNCNQVPLVFPHVDQENQMFHSQMAVSEEDFWNSQQPQQPVMMASPHHQSQLYVPSMTIDALWRSQNQSHDQSVYGDASTMQMHARGSAMKTPIKILSDDELAETGSRGGLDIAAAAQPVDGAIINLDEDTNSSYGDAAPYQGMEQGNLDVSSTQAFNFNLTAMKVSTPGQDRLNAGVNRGEVDSTKKQLFAQDKVLSTIFEETKNSGYVFTLLSSLSY